MAITAPNHISSIQLESWRYLAIGVLVTYIAGIVAHEEM